MCAYTHTCDAYFSQDEKIFQRCGVRDIYYTREKHGRALARYYNTFCVRTCTYIYVCVCLGGGGYIKILYGRRDIRNRFNRIA